MISATSKPKNMKEFYKPYNNFRKLGLLNFNVKNIQKLKKSTNVCVNKFKY